MYDGEFKRMWEKQFNSQNQDYVCSRFSMELINLAISDLKAAKLLFQHGFYSQSVFMVQQSLEKAIKAILLKLKLVKIQELGRKIRHEVITGSFELIIHRLIQDLVRIAGASLDILSRIEKVAEPSLQNKVSIRAIREKLSIEICKAIQLSSKWICLLLRGQKELFRGVEELSKMALQKSTEESEETIKELIERIAHYNLLDLISSEVYELYAKISKQIAELMKVLNKERQIKISKNLADEIRRIAIYGSLATDLSILITWYAPFERNVGRVRYPWMEGGNVMSPSTVEQKTLIVEWSKEMIDLIEKQKVYECLKEFIQEQIRSQKCKEKLNAFEQYLKTIIRFSE